MRNHRLHALFRLLPLLAALSGCVFDKGDDQVADGGAQDFPNTIAIGAAVASHISDNSQWDQFSVIPSIPSFQSAESLIVAPESPETIMAAPRGVGQAATNEAGKALAKTAAAAADTVYFDWSDTATLQVARRIRSRETLLKRFDDTLTFRYDGTVADGVPANALMLESKGAEQVKNGERRQTYRYENTDSSGGYDKAVFGDRLPYRDGQTDSTGGFRYRRLVMLPGPDGDLTAAADNRPGRYSFARTRETGGAVDTLESFDVSDADGDGVLWGEGDSGVVVLQQRIPNPIRRPTVELVVHRMRAILFKDERKTYPISFRETRTEKDGRQVVFSVRGTRGGEDSTFAAGDTVIVSVHVIQPAESDLVEKHARYKVILDGEPKRFAGNRLLRYTLESSWRRRAPDATRFDFTPDLPVTAGETALTGNLEMSADFAEGVSDIASGRFENKFIDVELIHRKPGRNDRRFRVKWKASGEVVEEARAD